MALVQKEVDLANVALGYFGHTEVSVGGSTKADTLAERFIYNAVDEITMRHFWNCATKRKILTTDTVPLHEFDYEYTLPTDLLRLWRLGSHNDDAGTYDHRIEGGKLVTNYYETPDDWATATVYRVGSVVKYGDDDTVYECNTAHTSDTWASETANWTEQGDDYVQCPIIYIRKMLDSSNDVDTTEMPPTFYECCALNLAIKLTYPLIQDDSNIRRELIQQLEQVVLPRAISMDEREGTPDVDDTFSWIDVVE